MTAREFLERWPGGIIGKVVVDLSEFVAKHGLDAELPLISGDDPVPPTTMSNVTYQKEQEQPSG